MKIYRYVLPLFLLFVPQLAWADQCSDIVLDDARVISDVGRVETAARSLADAAFDRSLGALPAGEDPAVARAKADAILAELTKS